MKKFPDVAGLTRQVYEEEEYDSYFKFKHIAEDTFNKMQGRYPSYWVRRFGADPDTNRTGVRCKAFERVGGEPVLSSDKDAGYVPIKCLKPYVPVSNWKLNAKCELVNRGAATARFQLP